jgi:spore germination cell wall hydrolase CwlJ-like protein
MISAAILCLATNLYFEARGEPLAGQLAVGYSVMNRVKSPRYPDTVCGVIYDAQFNSWDPVNPIRHRCQYSWFCDGVRDDIDPTDHAMVEAKALAKKIYFGRIVDVSEGATHYHNTTVNPYWASELTKVLSVGSHIFYRY